MNSNLSGTICISRSRSDSSHPGAYSAPWKNSCFQISSSRVQLRKTKLNHPFAKLEEEIGKMKLKETPAKFFENIYVTINRIVFRKSYLTKRPLNNEFARVNAGLMLGSNLAKGFLWKRDYSNWKWKCDEKKKSWTDKLDFVHLPSYSIFCKRERTTFMQENEQNQRLVVL